MFFTAFKFTIYDSRLTSLFTGVQGSLLCTLGWEAPLGGTGLGGSSTRREMRPRGFLSKGFVEKMAGGAQVYAGSHELTEIRQRRIARPDSLPDTCAMRCRCGRGLLLFEPDWVRPYLSKMP